jgi:hypothetical protein
LAAFLRSTKVAALLNWRACFATKLRSFIVLPSYASVYIQYKLS